MADSPKFDPAKPFDIDDSFSVEVDSSAPKFDPSAEFEPAESLVAEMPEQSESDSAGRTALDALEGAGQGITFGFSDEGSSALESLMGAGEALITGKNVFGDEGRLSGIKNLLDNYQRAKSTRTEQLKEAQERSPAAYLGGELAGGLVLPGAGAVGVGAKAASKGGSLVKAARGVEKLLGPAEKGASALKSIGKMATSGAIQGATYGLGTSDANLLEGEVGELVSDAATAGTIGAAAGGGLSLAGKGVAAAGKGLAKAGKGLVEAVTSASKSSTPFIAAKYGLQKGQDIVSRAGIEENIAKPIEKLAENLADSVDTIGEKIGKPAAETINDVYENTLRQVGQDLQMQGDELTTFIRSNLDEVGARIQAIEDEAIKAGKTINIKDKLMAGYEALEEMALADPRSQQTKENLMKIFKDNMEQQLDLTRTVSKNFYGPGADVAGDLGSSKVTWSGKDIDSASAERVVKNAIGEDIGEEALAAAAETGAIKRQPLATSTKRTGFGADVSMGDTPGDILETTAKERISIPQPIDEIGIRQAKSLQKTAGSVAGNIELEGQLRKTAGESYAGIKQEIEKTLGESYLPQKTKYAQLMNTLEAAGVEGLEKDALTKQVITPDQFRKVFDRVGKAVKEGDYAAFNKVFDALEQYAPETAGRLRESVLDISKRQQQLVAGRGQKALEKAAILGSEAGEEATQAARTLEEVQSLQERIGGRDPMQIGIDEAGERVLSPQQRTREFVEGLDDTYFDSRLGASQDTQKALSLLEKYDPNITKRLQTEGLELAEKTKVGRIFAPEKFSQSGDAALSPRGVLLGSLTKLATMGGNFAGRAGRKVGADKIANAFSKNPEILGKFGPILDDVAQNNAALLPQVVNILNKDPEFQDVVEKASNEGTTGLYTRPEASVNTQKIKGLLNESPERLQEYGLSERYLNPLKRAAEKGDKHLSATHYVLSQFPDYREAMKKWNKED